LKAFFRFQKCSFDAVRRIREFDIFILQNDCFLECLTWLDWKNVILRMDLQQRRNEPHPLHSGEICPQVHMKESTAPIVGQPFDVSENRVKYMLTWLSFTMCREIFVKWWFARVYFYFKATRTFACSFEEESLTACRFSILVN